jgi:hypothetical protein
MVENGNTHTVFMVIPKKRSHLKDIDADGWITIK